ncbi:uncharacterized protein LOC129227334 [Uloborus diversus]|uniref:uncharacterized protein LOC129227334 n=1 Tax=Uloborus diversus TaxID=327109 RepID=UPI00240A4FB2|nr:uncharacterized protein LOC129227334 [Uloborus diversus]
MFILCNAGERLGNEAIGLINKLAKSEIYGLPNSVKFQIKLFITQAISQPTIMTACQFCTVSRPFFLTLVGTTFTCLVVFLQVKTNPAKFRAPGDDNDDRFGC